MAIKDSPNSTSPTQQSLNVFSDQLIIKKTNDGGHKEIVDTLPEADEDNVTVSEIDYETAKPRVEYPIERDHCTISKYRKTKSYRHSTSYFSYQYKVFDITVDRESDPEAAERIETVVSLLHELPELSEEVSNIDSYDEFLANKETVRRYEALYNLQKGIWDKDSLSSYALRTTARDFQIKQFSQGFYTIPCPYHSTAKQILSEKLQEEGLGTGYSQAWGGFIVEPEHFSEAYEIVEAAYHTADVNPILESEF